MAIQFNQIPGNRRVPFVSIEFNAGQAPYQSIARLLLMGQKTAAGNAVANQPILVTGSEDALFGVGSMLACMYKTARQNAPLQEIWCLPLDDAEGAAKAAGTIKVSGAFPVNVAGTVVLYANGSRVAVPVTTVSTPQTVAAGIVSEINDCDCAGLTAVLSANAVKATATATFAGTATADGTVSSTIDGVTYSAAVVNGDTAAQVATKFAAAINSAGGTQVTAVAAGAVVTMTAKTGSAVPNGWTTSGTSTATGITNTTTGFAGGVDPVVTLTAVNAGTLGNTIRVETRLYPDDGSYADALLTITQPTGGATDPSITDALAGLGDELWDWIGMPYAQSAYLAEIETWLDARWHPNSQVYGHAITTYVGSAGATQAFTSARNNWHTSVMPIYNAPNASFLWTAAIAAKAAQHLQAAPELSRPLQTVVLEGILPPKQIGDRWSNVQRQSFYFAGASGYHVENGQVQIDRLITTYQKNAWGQPDQSYLDVNLPAQLMYGSRALIAYLTQTYPRAALVDSNPRGLQGFATVEDIRNAIVHQYKYLVSVGVFENAELFEELLIVERNVTDPNRVDVYLPLDVVNQLRVLAINATSYLQFPIAA